MIFSDRVAKNQLKTHWSFLSQRRKTGFTFTSAASFESAAGRNFGGQGSVPSTMPKRPFVFRIGRN
jgi:hypothetical protein